MKIVPAMSPIRFSLLLVASLLLLACDSQEVAAPTARIHPVEIATLGEPEPLELEREFAGLVVPRQNVDIAFEISGKLVEITVDEGQRVATGDLIATLDRDILNSQRAQLQAELEDNAARAELNRTNRRRIEDLREDGFAAEQRLDELASETASLAAQRKVLEARLAQNAKQLQQSGLHAPYAGTVARRFLDVGAVAAPGTPVVRLLEDAGLEARIGVPARFAERLMPQQPVRLWAAGQEVETTILAVGNDVSRTTLTVSIRVAVPATLNAYAGDQAYLRLIETTDQSGYWMPLAAVTDGLRGLWSVYALASDIETRDGTDTRDVVETRDVHILYTDGERAFVRGALAVGDRVVQGGLQRIVPGQTVQAMAPGEEAILALNGT